MNKGDTISASEISNDIRKQREREMNVLLNRFQRPNEAVEPERAQHVRAQPVAARPTPPQQGGSSSVAIAAPPPPPPPPPQHVEAKCIVKRKSIGESLDLYSLFFINTFYKYFNLIDFLI